MKLNPKKFFFLMTAILVLCAVGGGAALYFANTLLQKRSDTVVDLKLQNRELEEQLSAYQAAKADVAKYSYLTDIINGALPQDKDQARSVREIYALAAASGITIKSIQFPSSSLGSKTAPTTPAAGATGTTTTTPTTPVTPPKTVTQALPVTGLTGVYSIPTIVTPFSDGKTYKVSYNQLIDFLGKIESNRRAMQVADIQITPLGQTATDSINFTLTLNIFIKP